MDSLHTSWEEICQFLNNNFRMCLLNDDSLNTSNIYLKTFKWTVVEDHCLTYSISKVICYCLFIGKVNQRKRKKRLKLISNIILFLNFGWCIGNVNCHTENMRVELAILCLHQSKCITLILCLLQDTEMHVQLLAKSEKKIL